MIVTILTTGTRGDTQPYVALGQRLKKKGYRVRVAASEGFKDFVEEHGLEYAMTRGDISKIASSDLAEDARNADSPIKFFLSMKNDELMKMFMDLQHDLHKACEGSDIIVYHPGAAIGYFVAKEMNIPSVLATPFPMSPTTEYPALLFYDKPNFGKLFNKITHDIFEQGFWMMGKNSIKKYWESNTDSKLKKFENPFRNQRTPELPTIASVSPLVFGRPKNKTENAHYDGYWFLEQNSQYKPSKELEEFLAAGEAPVYVGFGSIVEKNTAKETTEIVIKALKISGKRGVIAKGWGGMDNGTEKSKDYLFIDSAPHDWLFPRMSAVVHHGGAGTTAEGLRAGVPGVIIPHGNDQFAWGKRINELGVGAKAIPKKMLTAENLAEAIMFTQNEKIQKAARKLGEKIRAEKGAEKAADIIIDCLESTKNDIEKVV